MDYALDTAMLMIAGGVLWVIQAMMVAWVGGQKGRSKFRWFVLGLLLGFICLIALAAVPSLTWRRRGE